MKWRILACSILFLGASASTSDGRNSSLLALLESCCCFPVQTKIESGELERLKKTRRDSAEKAFKAWFKHERRDGLLKGLTYDLSVRWLNAELDLAIEKADRVEAFAAHLERMKAWGKEWESFRDEQPDHPFFAIIESAKCEADYWLAKERAEKK